MATIRDLLILIVCCFSLSAQAQFPIRGIVSDSITGKPVSFVTVGIADGTRGTITNDDGQFIIQALRLPARLHFYSVGYRPKSVEIPDTGNILISLQPASYQLSEVTVLAGEADRLFLRSHKKLQKEAKPLFGTKCFYRLLSKQDDHYTEMIETFYGAIAKNSGIKHARMEHGRYALVRDFNKENYVISIDFSLLSRCLDILNEHQTEIPFPFFPYRNGALKHFEFSIADRISTPEGTVIKVHFKPKKDTYIRCFSGYAYIRASDFSLMRLEARSNNKDKPPFFIFNKEIRLSKCNLYFDIHFTTHPSGTQVIRNINMKLNYDELGKQSDSLIHHVETYSHLLFYDYDVKPMKIKAVPDEYYVSDYEQIKQRLYLRQFWDENPILAETPVESRVRKSFEASQSFGKAFNKTSDTLEMLSDGYMLWDSGYKLQLDSIHLDTDRKTRLEDMSITMNGEKMGGLYGDLYFAWNCYHDSFYYCVLPLLDMHATWFNDSVIPRLSPEQYEETIAMTEILYRNYFSLLEVYKRKWKKHLMNGSDWCKEQDKINMHFQVLYNDWHTTTLLYLKESWAEGKILKWNRQIEEWLEEYKPYQ